MMEQRRRLAILSALVILVSACAKTKQAALMDDEIRTILRERMEGARDTAGIVVGLIDENGHRVISYGNETLNGDSVFRIASLSDVFTSILMVEMAERGELNLDVPVSHYLPRSVKVPTRGGKEILLRHLATHTSGLPENLPNTDEKEAYSVEALYAFLPAYQLTRDIGSEFEYSNAGAALLTHLLAARSGQDYETLLRTRLLAPLEMDHTVRDTSDPYRVDALRSTINDLLKFLAANLGLRQSRLLPTMQRTHQSQHTAYAGVDIGLGWYVQRGFDTEIVWHDGGGAADRSFIGFDRKKRRGVAMFWNSPYDMKDIGLHLLESQYPLEKSR